jgi:hypothetical protein
MENTTRQDERTSVGQDERTSVEQNKTVRELHEAELELISGAALPHDCFHWVNSSKSWGF